MFGFDDILGIASVASDIFGGQDTNNTNKDIAAANNATSIELANTAHQREVTDLNAAGLNLMLSYFGKGAAVPNMSMPNITNPYARASSDLAEQRQSSAAQVNSEANTAKTASDVAVNAALIAKTKAEEDSIRANIPVAGATIKEKQSVADVNQASIPKLTAEIQNLGQQFKLNQAETSRLIQETVNAVLTGQKIKAETATERMRPAQVQAETIAARYRPAQIQAETQKTKAQIPQEVAKSKAATAVSNSGSSIYTGVMSTAERLGKWTEDLITHLTQRGMDKQLLTPRTFNKSYERNHK